MDLYSWIVEYLELDPNGDTQTDSLSHYIMAFVASIVGGVSTGVCKIIIVKFLAVYKFISEVLEAIWTSSPAAILSCLACPSIFTVYAMEVPADCDLTIKVTANQWYWTYEYGNYPNITFDSMLPDPSSSSSSSSVPSVDTVPSAPSPPRLLETDNNVVIPVDWKIKFIVTSRDVMHSWSVPSLGLKIDAIPGRLNQAIVQPGAVGMFYGQCTELCGTNHAHMPICLEIVPENYFRTWVNQGGWSTE
uniref:cytochrome c oxidase subunit II n=1 Tax=Austromenopon paululum TaxID=2965261 RepID=UPI0026E224EB|nr:cytochrome c oxidase subunit II [Austromenopon paululum]WJJ69865.1 cytochrome c oxidase subunit 2 [Austromenopon paululum]